MAKITVDFSNASEPSFLPKHLPEGDYKAKIIKCETVKSKSDNTDMLLYTIEVQHGVYPFYCKLVPTQLWKLRQLLEAAGTKVPARAVSLDPQRIVGKIIGVSMEDDDYNGKLKSVVADTFRYDPDTANAAEPDDDEDDIPDDIPEDEEEEEEVEPEPKPKARKAKSKAKAQKVDDDEFLDFDDLD